MASARFFLTSALQGAHYAPLSDADLHHAAHVLRLRAGEPVALVDPDGTVWEARVASIDADGMRVSDAVEASRAWEPDVTVVLGVSKGSKIDDAIEGAVEVGVTGVIPVLTQRSVVKLDAEKRADRAARWQRVAEAAAKQSQRVSVPRVSAPCGLPEVLGELAGFDLVLVAWEEADAVEIRHVLRDANPQADARVAIVVGPEGGLSAAEVAELRAIGAVVVTLGPTILRAETAGVVAPALVVAELRHLHEGERPL